MISSIRYMGIEYKCGDLVSIIYGNKIRWYKECGLIEEITNDVISGYNPYFDIKWSVFISDIMQLTFSIEDTDLGL